MKIVLYHGTSEANGKLIEKHGFTQKANSYWKVKGKPGFVYLSLAYAPFYTMTALNSNGKGALIKVEVDSSKLYPEDDFIMIALYKKGSYTQTEFDKVNLEELKYLWDKSLKYMGNVCAKIEDIKILGVTYFDNKKLLFICDPVIGPTNYMILGDYYRELTEAIFQGKDMFKFAEEYNKQRYGISIQEGIKIIKNEGEQKDENKN